MNVLGYLEGLGVGRGGENQFLKAIMKINRYESYHCKAYHAHTNMLSVLISAPELKH